MGFIEFLQVAGIIAGSIITILTAAKVVVLPTYHFIKRLVKVFETIDKMAVQFSPNGGSTLRDAIDRIENRINTVEQRQKILFMDSPFAVFEANKQGSLIEVNRTYSKWTKMSAPELLGSGWLNLIQRDHRERISKEWDSAIDDVREFSEYVCWIIDEQPVCVHITAFPFFGPKQEVLGWIGVIYKLNTLDCIEG